jgi:AcrR family transcriptional regulator
MTDSKRAAEGTEKRLQKQKRSVLTRSALLRSARYVFARDGFEHARLEDIALRARKTRGAFYDNFKDKEDVFLAIFEEDVSRDMSEIGPLLSGLPTIEQRIEALAGYGAGLSQNLERMLLNMEFKLYAIRHPHKRKRLADLLRAMRVRTSIPEISRLLTQLDGRATRVRLKDSLAICGIMDGLTLNRLFDPAGLSYRTLVRYLKLCIAETLPKKAQQDQSKKQTAGRSRKLLLQTN